MSSNCPSQFQVFGTIQHVGKRAVARRRKRGVARHEAVKEAEDVAAGHEPVRAHGRTVLLAHLERPCAVRTLQLRVGVGDVHCRYEVGVGPGYDTEVEVGERGVGGVEQHVLPGVLHRHVAPVAPVRRREVRERRIRRLAVRNEPIRHLAGKTECVFRLLRGRLVRRFCMPHECADHRTEDLRRIAVEVIALWRIVARLPALHLRQVVHGGVYAARSGTVVARALGIGSMKHGGTVERALACYGCHIAPRSRHPQGVISRLE